MTTKFNRRNALKTGLLSAVAAGGAVAALAALNFDSGFVDKLHVEPLR